MPRHPGMPTCGVPATGRMPQHPATEQRARPCRTSPAWVPALSCFHAGSASGGVQRPQGGTTPRLQSALSPAKG